MGLFNRKEKAPVIQEERKVHLGGLLFNGGSGYSSSKAMKLSAVYCATNQISNSVALLPIQIVEKDMDENRPIEHPLYNLLNLKPNQKYNHYNMFKMAIESVILKGNAYMYIERDSNLNVKSLQYINPDFVQPMLQSNGTVKYLVHGMDGAVDAINMIHLWQHVDDQYNGMSLLKYAYNTLKGTSDAENTASKFYRGGAGLNGVLKASQTLSNDQKSQIKTSWSEAFSADGNGVAVLPQGLDYQPISVNPEDAQLLESREFNITEIARFFNISPIKLFQLEEVSYSSMESTQLSYMEDTIKPYVKMIEEEFNRKLFRPSEVGKIGVYFDFTSALQTNKQALAEYLRTLVTNGIMTIDDARKELGLPKLNTEGSSTTWMQISYGSADKIASGEYIKQNTQSQGQSVDNKVKQGDE